MSQSLAVTLFPVQGRAFQPEHALSLLHITGADQIACAGVFRQRRVAGKFREPTKRFFDTHEPSFPLRNAQLDQAVALSAVGRVVWITFGRCPLSASAVAAMTEGIPEDVRGDCIPTDPIVIVGRHPILQCLDGEMEEYLGNTPVAFKLIGYSTPSNTKAFYDALIKLPWFVNLRSRVEGLIGPTNTAFYLSV